MEQPCAAGKAHKKKQPPTTTLKKQGLNSSRKFGKLRERQADIPTVHMQAEFVHRYNPNPDSRASYKVRTCRRQRKDGPAVKKEDCVIKCPNHGDMQALKNC